MPLPFVYTTTPSSFWDYKTCIRFIYPTSTGWYIDFKHFTKYIFSLIYEICRNKCKYSIFVKWVFESPCLKKVILVLWCRNISQMCYSDFLKNIFVSRDIAILFWSVSFSNQLYFFFHKNIFIYNLIYQLYLSVSKKLWLNY